MNRWEVMVETDLQQLGLDGFLCVAEPAELPILAHKMKQLNATALNVIKDSCSKNVASMITATSAFEAFQFLKKLYKSTPRLQDLDLYKQLLRLQMRAGYDQNRFIGDFDKLLSEFAAENIVFPERFAKMMFFLKIDGIESKDSLYCTMFHAISALPNNLQTWDLIKLRFLAITLPKEEKKVHFKRPQLEFNNVPSTLTGKLNVFLPKIDSFVNSSNHCESIHVQSPLANAVTCNSSNVFSFDERDDDVFFVDDSDIKVNTYLTGNCNPTDLNGDAQKQSRKRVQPGGLNDKLLLGSHPPAAKKVKQEERQKMPLSSYTEEQQCKLWEASKEQKEAWKCSTCELYFHNPKVCPHGKPVCYRCLKPGHIGKRCPAPIIMPKSKLKTLVPSVDKFTQDKIAHVDLAANSHVYFDVRVFENYTRYDVGRMVNLMNRGEAVALGVGNLYLLLNFNGVSSILRLCNIQHVLEAKNMFISANLFNTQFSTTIVLGTKTGLISHRKIGKTILRLTVKNQMYFLSVKL